MYRERQILLKEELQPGLKQALFHNFSRYTDAFLELSDNAVSNRVHGKVLQVDVLLSARSLSITNVGGYGMGVEALKEFLQWGKIKKRREIDIGMYSQGGKAAMGYLGRSMVVVASPRGENVEYRLEDSDLLSFEVLKEYPLSQRRISTNEGYVQIEVGGLTRKLQNDVLKSCLVNTYRPLIEHNEVVINYNGEKLKVEPFPVEQRMEEISLSVSNHHGGFYTIRGWVGLLRPRSGIKGGLRCYRQGRLICDQEFFGHPDPTYQQTLNFLFGEIHLDHVPVITNKTDFDRSCIQWGDAQKALKEFLKPYVDELLRKKIEEPSEEERATVKEVRDLVTELLNLRKLQLKGSAGIEGEAHGQKSSIPGERTLSPPSELTGRKNEPRTPPPSDAVGKRRRLKEIMDWEPRPMDEGLRSIIEESKGRKLLVINNLFPGYRAAEKNSQSMQLYLLETASIQLALPDPEERISPREYIEIFDELFSFFCENLSKAKENIAKRKR